MTAAAARRQRVRLVEDDPPASGEVDPPTAVADPRPSAYDTYATAVGGQRSLDGSIAAALLHALPDDCSDAVSGLLASAARTLQLVDLAEHSGAHVPDDDLLSMVRHKAELRIDVALELHRRGIMALRQHETGGGA